MSAPSPADIAVPPRSAPRNPDALDCLLFDFGGTLDSDGVAWKERFHGLYRDEGVVLTDRLFYDADDPLVGTLAAHVGLPETARLLVANIEAGLGEDIARGRRIAERFLDETEATVSRNREVLKALAGRYRLGIVSNFYGNLHGVVGGLGIDQLFEAMVDSEVVGAKKPEPAIFQAAMGPMGVEAAATLMVGDSLRRDREGALQSGLDFIWIAPPDVQAEAGEDGKRHRVVASLDGLLGLLV